VIGLAVHESGPIGAPALVVPAWDRQRRQYVGARDRVVDRLPLPRARSSGTRGSRDLSWISLAHGTYLGEAV
jgi:hypothetical protein